jgi:hypothetical protein
MEPLELHLRFEKRSPEKDAGNIAWEGRLNQGDESAPLPPQEDFFLNAAALTVEMNGDGAVDEPGVA